MIFFIRISDNVVGSVSYCLHNTIFFGFNHDANIKAVSYTHLDVYKRQTYPA